MIKEQLTRVNLGHAQPLHNQPSEALRPEPIERGASLPPHFQGLSSPPARYSSPANTPLSLRSPLAPPRPPRPRGPKPMVKISANSHGTSSTATPSADVLPSAPPRYAHASTAVGGNTDRLGSQDNKFDATGTSDIAKEAASYDKHDVTSQLTKGRSEAQTRSPEHGSHSAWDPKTKTWKELPPAYDELMSHEESISQKEFTENGPSSGTATTGFEELFLHSSSLQKVFPLLWPPGCTEPPRTNIKCSPSDFPSRDSSSLPPVSEHAVCLPPKTPGHICAGRSLDIVFYRGDATALPMYGRGDRIEGHIDLKNTKDICQIEIIVRLISSHLPGLITAHRTAPTGIGSSLLLGTRSPANHPGSLKAFST